MSRKAREAQIEKRRGIVAANLLAGMPYRQIAGALGVSLGTIAKDVKIILGRMQREQVKLATEHALIMLAQHDRMLNVLWSDVQGGKLDAIDRALRILERKARLLGLDKPEKLAWTNSSGEREANNVISIYAYGSRPDEPGQET